LGDDIIDKIDDLKRKIDILSKHLDNLSMSYNRNMKIIEDNGVAIRKAINILMHDYNVRKDKILDKLINSKTNQKYPM